MAEVVRLPEKEGGANVLAKFPSGLVPTSVAQRIVETLEDCMSAHEMGIISGPSGAGKTTTVDAWMDDRPGVLKLSLDGQPSFDDKDVCWRLIGSLGTGCYATPPRGSMFTAVVQRIKSSFALCTGLIVDEAQHLTYAGFEALRGVHDQTHVPIVVIGSAELWEKLFGPERTRAGKEWAPIRSRFKHRCALGLPNAEDVALMCRDWGLTEPRCIEFVVSLATQLDGSLREAEGVVEKAIALRGAGGVTLRLMHDIARSRGLTP